MFAFPPGWQPAPCSWECPETHLTFQHPVLACLSVGASWRQGVGVVQEGSWRSLSLWPPFWPGLGQAFGWPLYGLLKPSSCLLR